MDLSQSLEPKPHPWGVSDLFAFVSFFVVTLLFLPTVLLHVLRVFLPNLSTTALSSEEQILLQGVLDLVWVGFIFFLIKVVHRRNIREALCWVRTYQFSSGSLIALGTTMAIAVLAVSSFFPPTSAPPIEKLIESTKSLYMLVAFGILLAPITEEIMFRGFLFNVMNELGGSRLAVPSTAILFAILHAPQLWGSWAGIVLIFVVGYVLSLVRERSRSLIPSLIVHSAYNGMLFGASALVAILQQGK